MLKHHSNVPAEQVNVRFFVVDTDSVHNQLPIRNRFQSIDTAYERAFSGTGRSDYDDHFPGFNRQIDVLQHMKLPVMFIDLVKPDHHIPPSKLY
jgi:hypothetical protein